MPADSFENIGKAELVWLALRADILGDNIYFIYLEYMRGSDQPLLEKRVTYNSMFKIAVIVWNIAFSSFYFGYCIVYLGSIPIETLKDVFGITLDDGTAQGLLNGCIPIGALAGALSSSLLISRFSRRYCF